MMTHNGLQEQYIQIYESCFVEFEIGNQIALTRIILDKKRLETQYCFKLCAGFLSI